MNPLTQSKNATILPVLIALTLGCFGLSPAARAVDPPPDGGYPNENTAEGEDALFSLTTGVNNTAVGFQALFNNTAGNHNTANGVRALYSNTTGSLNTAYGDSALYRNITGSGNTADGLNALWSNTTGGSNTANGSRALFSNRNGSYNTAYGDNTLSGNTNGNGNTALGYSAGNLTTGDSNIDIGNSGAVGESHTIRIGGDMGFGPQTNTYIAGISGVTVAGGVGVIIDTNGRLGTVVSSERYKDAIKPMDKASEAILALKPVTFHYKPELDPDSIPQFGLVAEEVEKVNPDLVARDEQGKPYTVRYEAVNAMLLNEFLKEHKKVEEQQATIAELKSTVAQQQKGFQSGLAKQQKQIEALTVGLQKVSVQVEMSCPGPQTVLNNQ